MVDIKLIRENPNYVKSCIKKREMDLDYVIDDILATDRAYRDLLNEIEQKKAKQNLVSKKIPQLRKLGESTEEIMREMKRLASEIKLSTEILNKTHGNLNQLLMSLPNLPEDDVNFGGKENNEVISYFKEKPVFDFEIKDHVTLCESLNLIDYEKGAKLGGSGSWVYKGIGARLEWALLNYFIDEHIKDGYEFILPPHMLNYESGKISGQFPKFEEEVFWIKNPAKGDKKFLLPTAETALVSMHADEMMKEENLPKKYIAYTPCYRREAGSYRSEERGMIRGHQFNKVEMVQYTTQEGSAKAFEELVKKAQTLVEKLGLHYRLSKLAAGDCSFSMARTYDIEVWIPSMEIYKEVSSASNARDYQARRGNTRYKDKNNCTKFVHTLNASGLATSRLFPAIIEQYQNKDGSVTVPEVLRKYIGIDVIK